MSSFGIIYQVQVLTSRPSPWGPSHTKKGQLIPLEGISDCKGLPLGLVIFHFPIRVTA